MAVCVKISPNMWVEKDPSFGDYSQDVVYGLMRYVDTNFSEALGMEAFSSRTCVISYNHAGDYPMCCRGDGVHHIFLRCGGDYWCQWIFQFAHEYCHHLIGGEMSGDITGLVWFEECVCELSSMYHLHSLCSLRGHVPESFPCHYTPKVRSYLENRAGPGNPYASETANPGFLYGWDTLLQEPLYHRAHYAAIAARMLPLFVENPCLWKIILHFGDMRKWKGVSGLFDHLERHAGPDYGDSLSGLRRLLLNDCP